MGNNLLKETIWNLFRNTGSVETYLLLKEIENDSPLENVVQYETSFDESEDIHVDR